MNHSKNKLKIIFSAILVLFVGFKGLSSVEDGPASYTLKGQIEFNPEWKNSPCFRIFFDGQQVVSNQNGSYTFPGQSEKIKKYGLIICKNFRQNFDKINTIDSLSVNSEKPYKYFSFKLTGTNEKGEEIWKKKDKDSLDKKGFIIPDKCIIAQINPKYVDMVDVWDINLKGNFIKLPRIFLKSDIDEQKLVREANKSILYSLESLPFHESVKEKEWKKARVFEEPKAMVVLAQ